MKKITAIVICLFMALFGNLFFNYSLNQYRNSTDHVFKVVEELTEFQIVPSTKQDVQISEKQAVDIALKSVTGMFDSSQDLKPISEHVVKLSPGSTGNDAWAVIFANAKNSKYPNMTFTVMILVDSQTGELLDGIGFNAQQYEND